MKIDVLAIGELLADFISNEYVNSLANARQFNMFQGGSPSNLCANLNWLGKNTALIACVGNDGMGAFLIQSMEKIGVHSTFIHKTNDYPSSMVLVGKSRQSPDFVAYRMADIHIPPVNKNLLNESRIIHTSAFALSKNPAQNNILAALIQAKEMGKIISCDWNFSPKIWNSNNGQAVFQSICQLNPLLKLSLDDFKRFTGNENATAEQAITFLTQFNTQLTCLTCGSEGVWFTDETKKWVKLPAIEVTVLDTTGAGDAFWAGFLSGYLDHFTLETSVEMGISLATRKIQQLGPLYL